MEKKKAISQILTTLEIEALLRESKVEEAYSNCMHFLKLNQRMHTDGTFWVVFTAGSNFGVRQSMPTTRQR